MVCEERNDTIMEIHIDLRSIWTEKCDPDNFEGSLGGPVDLKSAESVYAQVKRNTK